MVFGSGKKAAQRELRGKIEGILSILEEMTTGSEAAEGSSEDADEDAQTAGTSASIDALKKALGQVRQGLAEMNSAHEHLLSEYEEFVGNCQGKDDLAQDARYQLASDFFSFLVAESAKNRKKAELLGQDLSKLSEDFEKQLQVVADVSAGGDAGMSEGVDKVRVALMDLASFLSVDVTGPSEGSSG